jgi:NlpC/P60 family putative phage cell wall peptidase
VWRELHGREPEVVPAYTQDWSEAAGIELLWLRAAAHLLPVAPGDEARGDVILFRMREGMVAKHLGIAAVRSGVDTFIHAYSGHAVTESALSTPWARRVVARFRFPERSV